MKRALYFVLFLFSLSRINADETASYPSIESMQGEVSVIKDRESSGKPAKLHQTLRMSDTLMTGLHAFCAVQIDPDNLFRIKQSTEVKIKKIWEESRKENGQVIRQYSLHLLRGSLSASLQKLPKNSRFEVQSPEAVAGVLGTRFNMDYNPKNGKTLISVIEHTVWVQSIQEPEKETRLERLQSLEISSWPKAILNAMGRGLPPQKKNDFSNFLKTQRAAQNKKIRGLGKNASLEKAQEEALEQLSNIVLNLRLEKKQSLQTFLNQNPAAAEKIFKKINSAQWHQTRDQEQKFYAVTAEITLSDLREILHQDFLENELDILPISLEEYNLRFGPAKKQEAEKEARMQTETGLTEKIHEIMLDSKTSIGDIASQNHELTGKIRNLVQKADIQNTEYFSDGSILLHLKLSGKDILEGLKTALQDRLGNVYFSHPRLMNFSSFHEFISLERPMKKNNAPQTKAGTTSSAASENGTSPEVKENEKSTSFNKADKDSFKNALKANLGSQASDSKFKQLENKDNFSNIKNKKEKISTVDTSQKNTLQNQDQNKDKAGILSSDHAGNLIDRRRD